MPNSFVRVPAVENALGAGQNRVRRVGHSMYQADGLHNVRVGNIVFGIQGHFEGTPSSAPTHPSLLLIPSPPRLASSSPCVLPLRPSTIGRGPAQQSLARFARDGNAAAILPRRRRGRRPATPRGISPRCLRVGSRLAADANGQHRGAGDDPRAGSCLDFIGLPRGGRPSSLWRSRRNVTMMGGG